MPRPAFPPMRRENEVAHQACSIVRREGIGQAGRSSGFHPFPADPPSRCRHQWRDPACGGSPHADGYSGGTARDFHPLPYSPPRIAGSDGAPARLSSEIRLYSTRLRLCCQFPFRSKQQDPPLETLDFPPAIPYNEHDRLEPDFDMPPVSKTAGWNRKVCSFMTDAIHPDTDIQAEETPILTLDPFAQVTPGLEPARRGGNRPRTARRIHTDPRRAKDGGRFCQDH